MKNFQRFCAAVVLTLTLTLSAFAGYMSTGATEPPPDSTQTTEGHMHTGAEGDMHTGVEGHMHTWNSEANAASIEAVLGLLQSVLPLF